MAVVSLSDTAAASTTVSGGFVGGRGGCSQYSHSKVSFCLSPKPKNVSSHGLVVKAQANKVVVDGSRNASPLPTSKSRAPSLKKKTDVPSKESSAKQLGSEESISQFLTQAVDLIKFVDSRDIMELQLKQLDCEILIKKKEAIQQAHTPTPVVTVQPPPPPAPPSPPAVPAPPPAGDVPKVVKSSLPPFKCPMAGTFYRCPGPGEPPFVKVGDKVQKGQVLCIIEAMKLMNEIEADQSGTIVEILAEDAKPVSFDTPLFVIQP